MTEQHKQVRPVPGTTYQDLGVDYYYYKEQVESITVMFQKKNVPEAT